MLNHKLADVTNTDQHDFMKEVMEQTKLQKTVYSKYDEKSKNNGCLLITPGNLKDGGVTASKVQKHTSSLNSRNLKFMANDKKPANTASTANHTRQGSSYETNLKVFNQPNSATVSKKKNAKESAEMTPQPITPSTATRRTKMKFEMGS